MSIVNDTQITNDVVRDDRIWQARIDQALSTGLSNEAARQSHDDADRVHREETFEAFREQCATDIRPILDFSVDMLREWGLTAKVTETLRDQPIRMARTFDVALEIEKFGGRGPGRLTISGTEAHEMARVKLLIGPSHIGGEGTEHVGSVSPWNLSEDVVGGLVAMLIEQLFR